MRRATYKEISRAWLKIFEKRRALNKKVSKDMNINKDTGYKYTDYKDFLAKGDTLDIWGKFVVPGSADLKVRLFIDRDRSSEYYNNAFIVTSITEYFFWFIPFTYDEYIIKLPEEEYSAWPHDIWDYYCNYSAQQAVPYIATAEKWNINHKMVDVDTDAVLFFKHDGTNGVYYACGNNDYQHLICTEKP